MNRLIALALPLLLLFGCIGQDKYDALRAGCDQEKTGLNVQLASKDRLNAGLTGKIADCNAEKATLNAVVSSKDSKITAMKNDSDTLALARQKASQISQYQLVSGYYSEAYGPTRIPNSARLGRIETAVLALNDSQLSAAWNSVRNCGGVSDCGSAKANFTSMIEKRISALAAEISIIVK